MNTFVILLYFKTTVSILSCPQTFNFFLSLSNPHQPGSTFGLVDSDGPCYAVMVYNVVQSWGVLIGDSVAIPEPNLRHHQIQHKGKVSDVQESV